MPRGDDRFQEEEAKELWRRAIELQMAADRDRTSDRNLPAPTGEGLSIEQVARVAEGAGIDPEYVALAVAERRLPDHEAIRRDRWTARWLRRVASASDHLEVDRRFDRDPEAVLQAFKTVVDSPEFRMAREDRLGGDPLSDAILVYRARAAPGFSWGSTFHGELEIADIRAVFVSVRPEDEGTRIRLRAPLFRRGLNLGIAGVLTGGLGAGGSYGGVAAGGALASWLGGASVALLAGPAVLGGLVGGAVGVAGFRKLYRTGIRSGRTAFNRLLHAVATELDQREEEAR